ncbi:MAG TPA: ParB/RepB/Spo0J family partition protein, partial [Candidatus Angelobacter sp.]|nr:ParB/RepB/Spo0J family partition protein [Candidatus Angelobacter sp.]
MINDKRKALGRGLDSLLPAKPAAAPITMPPSHTGGSAQEVLIDSIDANPYQTRRRINEAAMEELAESIRASGVVQPVVLRPGPNGRFQLVAGERRWHASKRAGKTTIPAVIRQIS